MRFNASTPIKFYGQTITYVPGQGNTSVWAVIKSGSFETFWVEWSGAFGDRAMSAQALGVKDSATIRMTFNPTIYDKLRTEKIVIVKNADSTAIVGGAPNKNNPNVYELWGGIDNVKEERQFMEFKVRRYEGL